MIKLVFFFFEVPAVYPSKEMAISRATLTVSVTLSFIA